MFQDEFNQKWEPIGIPEEPNIIYQYQLKWSREVVKIAPHQTCGRCPTNHAAIQRQKPGPRPALHSFAAPDEWSSQAKARSAGWQQVRMDIDTITGWWCNNHLEKYESQWEGLSHIWWKIKNVWNHQPNKNGIIRPRHLTSRHTWHTFEEPL